MRRLGLLIAVLAAAGLVVGAEAGAEISGKRARAFAAELAALGPRVAGTATEGMAADLVAEEFRELGYRVRRQAVRLPEGGVSRNVVARSPARPRAIVVAHLDGVSGTVAANDNGSGVAVMLEVARALAGTPGVLFAAVGAEERVESGSPTHLGSAKLSRVLPERVRDGIRLALSLDMVGVGARLEVRGIEPRPNRSARLVLEVAASRGVRTRYAPDTGVSDHAELTRAGVPAAWIQYRFDAACWHRPCDTA
ncbi:MAG: M28 family metallopeptidase, partial [Gaiellales bacterium]